MSLKVSLEDITQRLKSDCGSNFEIVVAKAFEFLGFLVEIIPETQAESDLIVKAFLSEKPYFVIIECNAVREGEFVSYQKLGQIRGNAPKYFTEYGKEFPTYYKMIVGRPAFSKDTKKHAFEDVVLLSVDVMTKLLEFHNVFQFSQDELRSIFETKGEVTVERVNELANPYLKNLRTCALVFMALLQEPTSSPDRRKKERLHFQNLLGLVTNLGWFLNISDVTKKDVINVITELSSPLRRIIDLSPDERLRLTSISFEVAIEKMGRQGIMFREILSDFQTKIKSKQSNGQRL
jgi:hypothetical protein